MERDPEAKLQEDLDQVLDAVAAGDATSVDRLLEAHAEPELSRLAAVARQVEETAAVAPPPAVRARHVRMLMEEASKLRGPQPVAMPRRSVRHPLRRRVFAWLGVLVALLVVAAPATAALASNAQPGQPLYGTKLTVENVRLALQRNPAKKVILRLEFAEQRTAELSSLLAAGRTAQIGPVAAKLATQQGQIQTAIRRLQAQGRLNPALLQQLTTLLAQHLTRLSTLSQGLGCNGVAPRRPVCMVLLRAEVRIAQTLQRLRGRQGVTTIEPAAGPSGPAPAWSKARKISRA